MTAGVVLSRLGRPPDIRFFTPAEEAAATALCDRLLGQDGEPKVPSSRMIDARLAEQETDGWRYADMPEDGQAWRDSLRFLDEDARPRARPRVRAGLGWRISEPSSRRCRTWARRSGTA